MSVRYRSDAHGCKLFGIDFRPEIIYRRIPLILRWVQQKLINLLIRFQVKDL